MEGYPQPAVERAMKVQEVLLRAASGKLHWWQAAEILGVSVRTMRRLKWRYEQHGYDGLFDRRRRRPSPKRVPLATVQQVLQLYQQQYHDLNVRHFYEKLREQHQIKLSYQWVKTALQTAGLVKLQAKRGPHRQRRERRPLRGMMLMVDGSSHGWIPALAGRRQDLIVFMDDATSEVYSAQLVAEEGTWSVLAGLREVIAKQGIFCSLYTDRGSHFFHTPRAGEAVDQTRLTQIGQVLSRLGIEHIPSYSPQGRGRMERLFGSWQGRLPQELRLAGATTLAEANRFISRRFIGWHNRHWVEPARESGHAFVPCPQDLDELLCLQHERTVAADNTISFGKLCLQLQPTVIRCSFAKCRVKVCEHLDGTLSVRFGPHLLGRFDRDGQSLATRKAA